MFEALNNWVISIIIEKPSYRKQAKAHDASWLTLVANNILRNITYFHCVSWKNHLMFTLAVVQNLWNICIKFLPGLSKWGWKERKRYCQAFWVTHKRNNVLLLLCQFFGLLFWSSVWFDKPYHVFCGLKQHRIQLSPQLGLLRVCERRIVGGLCHSNMGTAFRHSDTQRWNFSLIWGTSKFWSFPKCSSLFFWFFESLVCNTDYLSYFTRSWKEIFSSKCSLIPTKSATVLSSHAHLLPLFLTPCLFSFAKLYLTPPNL